MPFHVEHRMVGSMNATLVTVVLVLAAIALFLFIVRGR